MLRLVVPLLVTLLGAAGGIGAGLYFKPAPETPPPEDGDDAPNEEPDAGEDQNTGIESSDFVRLSNQFVIPVIEDERTVALVVLSLSLETRTGMREAVFLREPKLRASFLQVMFDHANAGGFDGSFTSSGRIEVLRRNLREAALPILGPDVYDILITDIARQES